MQFQQSHCSVRSRTLVHADCSPILQKKISGIYLSCRVQHSQQWKPGRRWTNRRRGGGKSRFASFIFRPSATKSGRPYGVMYIRVVTEDPPPPGSCVCGGRSASEGGLAWHYIVTWQYHLITWWMVGVTLTRRTCFWSTPFNLQVHTWTMRFATHLFPFSSVWFSSFKGRKMHQTGSPKRTLLKEERKKKLVIDNSNRWSCPLEWKLCVPFSFRNGQKQHCADKWLEWEHASSIREFNDVDERAGGVDLPRKHESRAQGSRYQSRVLGILRVSIRIGYSLFPELNNNYAKVDWKCRTQWADVQFPAN